MERTDVVFIEQRRYRTPSHDPSSCVTGRTRAAVLHAFGAPQTVEELELRPPGEGEVLVRLAAAGVCHSDVGQADGEWPYPLPAVLGHEGAGVVTALGPGVEGLAVGQRVVLNLAPGCGRCVHCAVGRPILCQASLAAMGDGRLTTGASPLSRAGERVAAYSLLACFAEHAVVAARSAVPLPDGVPAAVAALLGCAVVTGVGAAVHTIEVQAGSRGIVIGCGGVGMNAVQGARLCGAAEIVVADVSPGRLERAGTFGATATLDVTDGDRLAALRASAADDGFDWSIVTVGKEDACRLGVDLIRPGGTCAVVGLLPDGHPVPVDMLDLVTYEKRIVGSAYGTLSAALLLPRLARLYLAGRLELDAQVSDRYPLEAVNEAFDRSRRAEGVRPVLELAPGGEFAA